MRAHSAWWWSGHRRRGPGAPRYPPRMPPIPRPAVRHVRDGPAGRAATAARAGVGTRGPPARIVVLGDLMLDVVLAPAVALETGTDVPGRVSLVQGGSAANTARWLGRLGARSELIARGRARRRGAGARRRDPARRRRRPRVARRRGADRPDRGARGAGRRAQLRRRPRRRRPALAGRPPGRPGSTAPTRSTCRSTRCSASRSGWPAGAPSSCARRAGARGQRRSRLDRAVARRRPTGRPRAHRRHRAGPAVRDGRRGRGVPRRPRRSTGSSTCAVDGGRQARSEGRDRARPASARRRSRFEVATEHLAVDRHDGRGRRVRRRVPRRLVRGACGGSVAAGVAPARGDRRAPGGRPPADLAAARAAARLRLRRPYATATDAHRPPRTQPEVAAALAEGRPVVALESTLISHGLPYPQNLEVATASEAAVRASGAVPATVAIHDGRLLVGLDEAALEALATAPAGSVRKAARPSLAAALAGGGWAATTVSATMIAAHAAGIRGLRDGRDRRRPPRCAAGPAATASRPTFDISSDLEELGRTPMAVVCAGPKAILDVPATLEYLETRGVPVVAVGQADLPGFYARSAGIAGAVVGRRTSPTPPALVATHLGLGLGGGILVCVPSRPRTRCRTTSRARPSSGPSPRPRRRASPARR